MEYGSGKLESHYVAGRFAFHLMWKNENKHTHTHNTHTPHTKPLQVHGYSSQLFKASTIISACTNVDQYRLIVAENPDRCRTLTQNIFGGCGNQWDWEVLRIWKYSTVACLFLVKFSFCFASNVYYKEEIYPWLLKFFSILIPKYLPMVK